MTAHRLRAIDPTPAQSAGGDVRVGRLVEIIDGRPWIGFGEHARVLARVALALPVSAEALAAQPLLLVLENGDATRPIIVGLVADTLPAAPEAPSGLLGDAEAGFELNGKQLSFEGREEVVLRCGQASITLRADGQVVVKGTRLTSRASETHKIRGATVLIN